MTRIAIAHDYLTQRGGAERVVLALSDAFPNAPIYTSLFEPARTFREFWNRDVRPLWLNRSRVLRSDHRIALPLLPIAWSSARISADLVICSSSGWSHAARTAGIKIVYCHSPAKWLYRSNDYLGAGASRAVSAATSILTPALRRFDRRAAGSADMYLANSSFIRDQIRAVYDIEAAVLPPPIGIQVEGTRDAVGDLDQRFFLTVSRLLPYKNVRPTVEAFRDRPESHLVVVGDGPQRQELIKDAPSNVTFLTEITDAELRWLYANCVGVVAASREDFGLVPLEAAAFGKPVAALNWGGFLDTVRSGETGTLFDAATPADISRAVNRLESEEWDSEMIRLHAASFSRELFIEQIRSVVDVALGGNSK